MTELLLHLLVLSVFAESVTVGPFRVGRVLAVAAIVAVCFAVAAAPGRRVLPRPAVWVPVAGLTMWAFVSVFWAESYTFWVDSMLQLTLALCYVAAYVVLIDSREQVRRLLRSYVLGATAAAVLGIVQGASGERAVGLQGDPNLFALYEVAALPVAVVLAGKARGVLRLGWLAVAGLLVGSVLSAQSRGGLVAAGFIVLWLLWRGDLGGVLARRRGAAVIAGTAGLALFALWAVSSSQRFDPEQVEQDRGSGRVDIWHVAWQAWQDHPVLGLGAGGFEASSSALLQAVPGVELDPRSEIVRDGIEVHNGYLEPLVELGPVGLGLYLGLLGSAAAGLAQRREPGRPDMLDACLVMLGAFALATIFLSVLNNKLLWMLIGLAAVLPVLPQRRTRASATPT